MNGYNFTDRVRKVLQMAREEATRLHHEYVGTEHLLLGLLDEGEGVAIAVLTNLGAEPGKLRDAVERSVTPGTEEEAGPDLPYTAPAKKVLELAMSEARHLGHSYVGTEHLLLGLLREEKGIAAQVLKGMDVSTNAARAETIRLLQSGDVDPAYYALIPHDPDQQFKTAIGLIELHRVRYGRYPASIADLEFLGHRDQALLRYWKYEQVSDGYTLDFVGPGQHAVLTYPKDFWRGLGLRASNVAPGRDS